MLELYIDNHPVDLSQDVRISLSYQVTDVSSPSTIRNSFSTTVKVKGTRNNNEIFGHIYRLDSQHMNFDSNKRVPFRLIDNGDVVESGYIKLDSIDRSGQTITYNITLFGGLGDFFYSLMYNEDGTERSLRDIHFGWYPTLEEENYSIITTWDRASIYNQWLPYNSESFYGYSLVFTEGVRSQLSSNTSYFTMDNGVLKWKSSDKESSIRSTITPIGLPQLQDAELRIRMYEHDVVDDDLCIVVTGSDNMDNPDLNNLQDVQLVISLQDIYNETRNSGDGYWIIKINPTWRYLWLTTNGDDFAVRIYVKNHMGYFSNHQFTMITQNKAEGYYLDLERSVMTGTVSYKDDERYDTYVAVPVPSFYSTGGYFSLMSSFYGRDDIETGVLFLNPSLQPTGFHKFNIQSSNERNVIYSQEYVEVPLNTAYVAVTTLKGYTPFIYWGANYLKYIRPDIIAVPTYNGLYDNFDSEHILVNWNSLSPEAKQYLPERTGDYGLYVPVENGSEVRNVGLAKIKTPRELVEWETRDLRSTNQRIGLKMSSILSAISNPANNGGYNVIFDSDIYDSPYFNESWVILDRPDFSNVLIDFSLNTSFTMLNDITSGHINAVAGEERIDLHDVSNYTYRGEVRFENALTPPQMYYDRFLDHITNTHWASVGPVDALYPNAPEQNEYVWYVNAIRFTIEKDGQTLGTSNTSLVYVGYGSDGIPFGRTKPFYEYSKNNLLGEVRSYLRSNYPTQTFTQMDIVEVDRSKARTENNRLITYEAPVEATFPDIPDVDGVTVRCYVDRLECAIRFPVEDFTSALEWRYEVNHVKGNDIWWFQGKNQDIMTDTTYSINLKMYNRYVGASFPEGYIDKNTLFFNTDSPFKYLTDFTKILNLKYVYDETRKSIFITNRYYTGQTEELTVNLDKGVNIVPTTLTSKYINIGLETPKTYAQQLYSLNNKYEYGEMNIDKEYDFNNETLKMIEDENIFKNVIPYRLTSHYLDSAETLIPPFIKSPTLGYTLFNQNNEQKEEILSLPFTTYSVFSDESPKMCMFNPDNKYMKECRNSLVFIAGKTKPLYILSDVFNSMMSVNDGKECYYWTESSDAFAYTYISAPRFLKTNTTGYSFNITEPESQFSGSEVYTISRTIYDWWRPVIEDMFSQDTKMVTLWGHLTDKPHDALRKFYFWDNSWWIISEIRQWCKDDYFTQLTLIKVNDKNNYLTYGN